MTDLIETSSRSNDTTFMSITALILLRPQGDVTLEVSHGLEYFAEEK